MIARLITHLSILAMALPLAAQQIAARKPSLFPTDAAGNEVQKSLPVREQDSRVLRSLNTLPVERLQELLLVYEKLDNTGMMDALVHALLRRDPTNSEALRVRDLVNPKEVSRDPGYLDALAKKVLVGEMVEDVDGVTQQASLLIEQQLPADAVKLLEALRNNQFKGKTVPFLDDLAYAYAEAEQYDQAEAAYKGVLADPTFSAESRGEAQTALAGLGTKKRIAAIRKDAGRDMDKLVAGSAQLYAEMPDDYDVTVFRIGALDMAKHYGEAVELLVKMRAKHHGPDTWPYLPTLAFAYFGSKQYDQAIAAFREIQRAPDLDAATKVEAENMILEIQVSRLIERGTFLLDGSHIVAAQAVLAQLERDFGTHPDVLGYKAMVLTKQGKSNEALALLFDKKRADEAQHLPFSQQDVISDVYLELKDYGKARSAALAILNDARYDEEFRGLAVQKLQDIMVAELLEQGSRFLDDADRTRARAIERQLESIAPSRLDVRTFAAEVALAYNRDVFARDQLLSLKQLYPNQPFPGQTSLGSALAQSGLWEEAYNAYGEILNVPGYDPDDLWEARNERRTLAAWFRPTARIDNHFEKSEEGSVSSSEGQFSTRWYGNWRFNAFVRSDFTKLDKASDFGGRSSSRFEGGITAMRRFTGGYFAEATVGASKSDALYGIRVGKLAYQSLGWSLGYTGNARATDSTTLQALNGRQDRAEFKLSGPIGARLLLDFEAYYQTVKVGGSKLGSGFGFEGSLDYIIQTETRKRPEILIGYYGEYRRFESVSNLPRTIRDQIRRAEIPQTEVRPALAVTEEVRRAMASNFGHEVMDGLIDPETNRHGIELKVRKHLNDNWTGYIQAGTYYSFDDDTPGWEVAAGLEYWLNDDTMLFAEFRYDSDGKGASSGSGVWEANVGGTMSF